MIVDTDTASDDAQALALAARSPRVTLEAVTVVAGNVAFDDQVANALHTLELAGADDVPVYPGARRPLVKSHDHATAIHGPTGLGALTADPDGEAADEYAVDAMLDRLRAEPGAIDLVALGPLTNLAEALRREPRLPELVRDVWVMGGAIDTRGNVTPAAEFNVWVDPDAARLVFRELPVTLVDWGVTKRDVTLGPDTLDRIAAADTPLAAFFTEATRTAVEWTEAETGRREVCQPDAAAVVAAASPELVRETTAYEIHVDDRPGLTRGYTLAREPGPSSEPAADGREAADPGESSHAETTVIDSFDADGLRELLVDLYETA